MQDDEPNTVYATIRTRGEQPDLVGTLTVVEGPATGSFFELDPDRERQFGRGDEADFRVVASSVSRLHAGFRVVPGPGHPQALVRDLGSTNRVIVNGVAVGQSPLLSGDKVRLGDVLLRFEWMPPGEVEFQRGIAARILAAERDPLTGVLDRAYVSQRLGARLVEWDAAGHTVTVVMLDIDHFKRVNDTWGHDAGDKVLRAVGAALLASVGIDEVAVRYGGEEFLLVLPRVDQDAALTWAEALRSRVEATELDAVAPGLRVTVSLGVAERVAGEPLDAALQRADAALYDAKRSGRNRVRVAPSPAEGMATLETPGLR